MVNKMLNIVYVKQLKCCKENPQYVKNYKKRYDFFEIEQMQSNCQRNVHTKY